MVDSKSTGIDGLRGRFLWELVTDGGKMVTLQQIAYDYLKKGQGGCRSRLRFHTKSLGTGRPVSSLFHLPRSGNTTVCNLFNHGTNRYFR
jgi:hypothetical protein